MGIFSKKEELRLPELPKLPNLPRYEPMLSRDIGNSIKDEVEREIPVREKEVKFSAETKRFNMNEEKPLFIKIDKYKEAVTNIDNIKSRITEAENIIEDLENMKNEEEKKLQEWKEEIENIKSKLLEIDKELFEL